MTTDDVTGTELTAQAQDVWAIIAPALQDSDGPAGLPARAYQALQTWPDQHVPDELWTDILALLPLEDQTRLAHTSHHVQGILERLAPQALDPAAHNAPGFIRTIYTQTELNTSLSLGRRVAFIPGTGGDLTIGQGWAHVHGPGTLTAVTGGSVTVHGDIHIITVTDGNVRALDQATITTVTGGTARVFDQASMEEVTGGHVTAEGQTTITTVTGGTVTATDNATITAVSGDAHIIARGNAQVTIEASASGVRVDAYDAAHITAHNGNITLHSPDVTVTSNGDAVINHA
ncbi:hypothetical protein [Streptomyces sp. NPDC057910]|uniref:hypothetical protein n=1 Tax=Streptomyces sp. NPDC057910 TaxID=3346278 RepID=UPI0036EDD09D